MELHNLKVVRIYNTADGHSHFEDIELPLLYPVAKKLRLSKAIGAGKFFEFDSDYFADWHTSKTPIYFIYLQGAQEVEVSDGEKRKFSAGDILLAEDIMGHGHRSWSISNDMGRVIILEKA